MHRELAEIKPKVDDRRQTGAGEADLPGVTTEWPKSVTSYQTSDRELHDSKTYAEYRQRQIDGAVKATEMLRSGASLGAALRTGGFLPDGAHAALDEVTQDTKLIIEHWQCRSEPGYRPYEITKNGGVFVHGHAGSWSGPYGNVCSPQDVERYWIDTKNKTRHR